MERLAHIIQPSLFHAAIMRDERERLMAPGRKRNREYAFLRSFIPAVQAVTACRSRIAAALRASSARKTAHAMELIGCRPDFLVLYLESEFTEGMSWDNHGEWEIDHIRPCASFDLTDESQQRACFHWSNLQPLWREANRRKGARYIPQ